MLATPPKPHKNSKLGPEAGVYVRKPHVSARSSFVIASLALASCTSEAEKLQQQYEIMQRAGVSKAELCEQSQKVARAHLEAGDESEYQLRKIEADLDCNAALLERL
jgi:hypothetical protein